MLHFPDLEPTELELQDSNLLIQMEVLKRKKIQNLLNVDFQVKIVDFGLACHLAHGDFAMIPCGTRSVIAPEALMDCSEILINRLQTGYDHRVDVWGIGQICYMLLTSDLMFKTDEELYRAKWPMKNLDCSIESIRFISETVTYYMDQRPFPD